MMMITRRRFVAFISAAAASLAPMVQAQTRIFSRKPKQARLAAHPFVYFGTDTSRPGAKGIYLSRFDPSKGQLSPPVLVADTMRPVYLAANIVGGRHLIYATNEGDANTSSVSTFLMDTPTGALKLVGQVPTAGAGPCYIAATGQFAYIANYSGGTVTAYRVQPDGTLSQPVQSVDFHDKLFGTHGPNASRQDGPHPHSATLSLDDRFLIVNDLGNDNIVIFPVHPDTGHLGNPTITGNRTPGAGPRHLAFHPNGRWAYGIDELSSQIDCYLWNTTHGTSAQEAEAHLTDTSHSVSTLDPSFHGTNTAAEIEVSPNGFFLYASNRGEDSLVVFAIDQTHGSLTLAQRISIGGKGPRHFTLDMTGKWLICGNQDSASVTTFACNPGNGHLTGPVQTLPLDAPVFTLFV